MMNHNRHNYCQGKSREQETHDSMAMLCIVVFLVTLALSVIGLFI